MIIYTRIFETWDGKDKTYGHPCMFETIKVSVIPVSEPAPEPAPENRTEDRASLPKLFVVAAWVGLGDDAWPRAITPPISHQLAGFVISNIQTEMGDGNHINMVSMYHRNAPLNEAVSKYDTRQKLREQAADNEQQTNEQQTNEQQTNEQQTNEQVEEASKGAREKLIAERWEIRVNMAHIHGEESPEAVLAYQLWVATSKLNITQNALVEAARDQEVSLIALEEWEERAKSILGDKQKN